MQLGINNLENQAQLLEHGYLYWLNMQDRKHAISFAIHTLHANNECANALILNSITADEIKNSKVSANVLRDVQAEVYETTNYPYFFKKLISDCERAHFSQKKDLIVVLLSCELVLNTDFNELKLVLNDLNSYLAKRKLTMVFISHNTEKINCSARLASLASSLTGLSSLAINDDAEYIGHYHMSFWRCSHGTIASGDNIITYDSNGYKIIGNEYVDITNADDLNEFHVVGTVFNPDNRSYPNIYRYHDNSELFSEAIKGFTLASCMFAINDRAEIDDLGRYIYELRKQRGNAVVILVCERLSGIRAGSERFLLSCGANFIFEASASSTYINAMLTCFKGYTFNRAISMDFEALLTRYHDLNQQKLGLLTPADFAQNTAAQLSNMDLDIIGHGLLIVFKIKYTLPSEIVAEQFIPVRSGDICTLINRNLAVFLPSCNEEELETALSRVFATDITKLFESYYCYSQDHEILNEVEKLNHESELKPISKEQVRSITELQTNMQNMRRGTTSKIIISNKEASKVETFDLNNLK